MNFKEGRKGERGEKKGERKKGRKEGNEVSLVESLLELNVGKVHRRRGEVAKINFGVCFSELPPRLLSTPYFLRSINCQESPQPPSGTFSAIYSIGVKPSKARIFADRKKIATLFPLDR